MGFSFKNTWNGLDFWDKEENQRQREQAARPQPARAPSQSWSGNRDNQPGFQWTNNSLTRGLSRGYDQFNMFDGGRTWKQRTPTTNASTIGQMKDSARKSATGIGLGVVRSGIGMGQSLSGLYDLASPGTGTNRLSNKLDSWAKFTDQTAKNEGASPLAYKGGQLAGELVGMKGSGAIAKQVIGKAPRLANFVTKADNLVTRVTNPIGKLGAGGRIVQAGLREGLKPVNQISETASNLRFVGEDASKGRDISPQRVAADVGFGTAMNFGSPAVSQIARELRPVAKTGAKIAATTAKNNSIDSITHRALLSDNPAYNELQRTQETSVAAVNRINREGGSKAALNGHLQNINDIQQQMYQMRRDASRRGSINPSYDDVPVPNKSSERIRTSATQATAPVQKPTAEQKAPTADPLEALKADGIDPKIKETLKRNGITSEPADDINALKMLNAVSDKSIKEVNKTKSFAEWRDMKLQQAIKDGLEPNNAQMHYNILNERALGQTGLTLEEIYNKVKSTQPTPPVRNGSLIPITQSPASQIGLRGSYMPERVVRPLPVPEIQKQSILQGSLGSQMVPEKMLPLYRKSSRPVKALGNSSPVNLLNTDYTHLPAASDAVKVLNGAQTKAKSLNQRIAANQNMPQNLRNIVDGSYVVKTNKETIKQASKAIFDDPQAAEIRALSPKDAVDIEIGSQLFKKYADQGNFAKAVDFVNASDASNHGQMIQILSQYGKTTPQGAVRFAQTAIKKYNKLNPKKPITLGEDTIGELVNRAKAIQEMPQGRERSMASQELMDVIGQLIPSSKTDKALTIWKAGLLTSPRTHIRNTVGNAVHAVAETAKDPIAALTDKLMARKTGARSMTATLRGSLGGTRQGLSVAKDVLKTGYDPTDDVAKYDINKVHWGNSRGGKIGKGYTETVFRTLNAEDKPFYYAAYNRSLNDQALTAAINAGKRNDKKFIQKLLDNPTSQMMELAAKDAETATFKNKNILSNTAGIIKRGLSHNKVGKVIAETAMPFTGVPSAVAEQFINYSPIGLIKGVKNVSKVMRGKISASDIPALQRQASQEVGRGVIGTGLLGIGAYLTSQGLMTGQPKDRDEAAQWELEGKQKNSVFINGKWRSINSIGPESLILLAGSKIQSKGLSPSTPADIGKDFLDQTFLKGVQGPLNAVTDSERYGNSYIASQAGSVIPNIVKDTAKAFDGTSRETNAEDLGGTLKNGLMSSFPYFRNQLLPRRDRLGNTIAQEPSGIGAYFDIFASRTPIKTDVTQELSRLNSTGNNATPSDISKKLDWTVDKKKVHLNYDQLNTLEQKSGEMARNELEKLMKTNQYKNASDESKKTSIDKIVQDVRSKVIKDMYRNGGLTGKRTYESTADMPQNLLDTAKLYGTALLKDPKNNISNIALGMFTPEQARKMTGNTLILKRQDNLSTMDGGNKGGQVDHKIPLSLGGTNDPSNLWNISTEANQKKAQYEIKLGKKIADKSINKSEARRLMEEYIKNENIQPVSNGPDTNSNPVSENSMKSLEKSASNSTTTQGSDSSSSYSSSTGKLKTNKEKYDAALKQYNNEKDKWSDVTLAQKTADLNKLSIKKDFSDDAVTLYGMSKSDIYSFAKNNKNGEQILRNAIAYGDKLVDEGLIERNKLRDKDGNISVRPKTKTTSSKKKSTNKKITKTRLSTLTMPTYSTTNRKLQSIIAATKR